MPKDDAALPALIRREDYAAPAYWIRRVDLTFDLDPAKTIVSSRLAIERNPDQPVQPLKLHGEDLTLLRVLVDGQSVAFRHEDQLLVIDAPEASAFTLEVRNTIAPAKNTQLSGLYESGSGLFTQCEAEGFRRITYFLDRPDVMAVYSVTLRADAKKYPVLLSNGNLMAQGEIEGGRHFAIWSDPFPKPSYLFALVAADLVVRELRVKSRGGKEHLLQVYVKRGDLEKTEHAMNSLVASLVWDEAKFNLPLDLERFMIVAVDDFNMGAMENKGLNIFNTAYVLASPATATDADFSGIESVVGHEYFHNWTGNRVTCRDWFQLSLKEGLTVFRDQQFSMDMAGSASARAVFRIADVRTLRERQFPEDAGPMAHPVRPEAYQAIDNFYTATVYEKGAEVVRMQHTLVGGQEGFARGMALYFERHDGTAATCDDFVQAMADANPASALATHLPTFKRWYAQAGTPRLAARGQWNAAERSYTLTLTQHNPDRASGAEQAPQVIPVRMGLVAASGKALPLHLAGQCDGASEHLLVLTEREASYTFTNLDEAPVPSLLRGFSAPVVLDDDLGTPELLVLLAHDADPFVRWESGQRLALAHVKAALAAAGPLPLAAAHVQALARLLREPTLDAAFKELALTLPSETYLLDALAGCDPERLHAVHRAMQAQLASELAADWAWAFDAHQVRGGYEPNAEQSGQRALANLALEMLVLNARTTGDTVWPGRAYQRVKDAGNMTDRAGALRALVNAGAELAAPALANYRARFAGQALPMDRWFRLQATAPEQDGRVFDAVKQLVRDADFTLSNPNRVRSLLSAWAMSNPSALHRRDGAGYAFWADRLLALDAANPQLASRLARALEGFARLPEPYRSHAQSAVAKVAAHGKLSADTREIIERALATAPAAPDATAVNAEQA